MIRPATLADLPALRALEQELFGPDAWSEELIRQEIDGLGRRFVVADDLSGYAVTMTAGDIVDLLRIGVRPDARRTGIASRLLDELLVDTEGASRMLLEVSVTNAAALGFYVARQFSVIDVRPHYYRDGSEALVMCRWLPGRRPRATPRRPMTDEPLVLGIETSCDETGVGIVRGHTLLADTVASSVEEHARFGGVVPEVASRAHLEAMVPTIERACGDRRHRPERHRRGGRHQRPGPGRRAAGRRGQRQGPGPRAGQADLRRQPPRRPRRGRPARARTAARAVPGHARLGRPLQPARGHRRDRRRRADGLDHRRRGGGGLRQGRPAPRACRSPAGPTSTGQARSGNSVAIDFPRGLTSRRDLERHRFDFSFSGLKTAVARWVEAQQRDGRHHRRRRRRRLLPGGGLRRADPQGHRRRHQPRHRGHPHRRRRGRQQPAARDGRGAGRPRRASASACRVRACAPTTAPWSPHSAPSSSPAVVRRRLLDLPADSSQPITTVVA